MPVLLRVFPQDLDPVDYSLKKSLRAAFQEWESRKVELQKAWIDFIGNELYCKILILLRFFYFVTQKKTLII